MTSDRLAWPIFLLILTVLVPSAGVVWMMREAVRNERAASDQRLREAYQIQLQTASRQIHDSWVNRLQEWDQETENESPASSFSAIVSTGIVDSVLIVDPQGQVLYPASGKFASIDRHKRDARWDAATEAEYQTNDYEAAQDIYARITTDSSMANERAYARQSQVRCLLRLGENAQAIELLEEQRQDQQKFADQDRSFAADAELQLLGLLTPESRRWDNVAQELSSRIRNYDDSSLSASQRLFLMSELDRITKEPRPFPTRTAEVLASEVAMADTFGSAASGLAPTSLSDVWSCVSPSGRIVSLYRTSTLRSHLLSLTQGQTLSQGLDFTIVEPGGNRENLMDTHLGPDLSGWRLGLSIGEPGLFYESSQQRNAVHLWIATLVIAATSFLAWILFNALRERLRMARIKNDLVATVSHELKTPLAAIRLLVDTLLNSPSTTPESHVQTREYLQLISNENARLTRLIDNFLTFSRLDTGKQRMDFQRIDLCDAIHQATKVFSEHTENVGDRVTITSPESMMIDGDMDMLVTSIVNLLENAWKYSGNEKRIELIVRRDANHSIIEVKDNGVGMSKRSINRAFDRFFQVDQRVARAHEGVGLGLSIVREIVRAHRGEISVESELGVGSTFTLRFPLLHNSLRTDQSAVGVGGSK